jgi:hypothetical protein
VTGALTSGLPVGIAFTAGLPLTRREDHGRAAAGSVPASPPPREVLTCRPPAPLRPHVRMPSALMGGCGCADVAVEFTGGDRGAHVGPPGRNRLHSRPAAHSSGSRSGSACAAHRRGIRAALRHAAADGRPSPNGPGSPATRPRRPTRRSRDSHGETALHRSRGRDRSTRSSTARTPCRTVAASRPVKCCLSVGITGPSGWPTAEPAGCMD